MVGGGFFVSKTATHWYGNNHSIEKQNLLQQEAVEIMFEQSISQNSPAL